MLWRVALSFVCGALLLNIETTKAKRKATHVLTLSLSLLLLPSYSFFHTNLCALFCLIKKGKWVILEVNIWLLFETLSRVFKISVYSIFLNDETSGENRIDDICLPLCCFTKTGSRIFKIIGYSRVERPYKIFGATHCIPLDSGGSGRCIWPVSRVNST
jgi:hypothetical protein